MKADLRQILQQHFFFLTVNKSAAIIPYLQNSWVFSYVCIPLELWTSILLQSFYIKFSMIC